MNIDFDQQLKQSLNRDIEVPVSVLNKVESAFDEIRSHRSQRLFPRKKHLAKKPWVAAAAAVVILGVTFNQPVIAAVKAMFWGNHAGIERAVNNGYQQDVQSSATKSQGIEIGVTKVFVDSARLGLTLDLKFDDIHAIKNVDHINADMVITDDNGNVIAGDGYVGSVGAMDFNTDITNKDNGDLKFNALLQSTSASIPKMSELNVHIKSISLFKSQASDSLYKVIKGTWNSKIALDQKLIQANEVSYTAQTDSKDVNIVSAKMLPTGFVVKFIVNTPIDESIVTKTRLMDLNGKIYSSSGSSSMERTADNKDLVTMTFEVTSFDPVDSFKFLVKDINGKDSSVILVKSTK